MTNEQTTKLRQKRPNPTRTRNLVIFAILTAIIFLMAFTPLGYLSVGIVSITFLMIPVFIVSATLGPLVCMGLGFVFGLTSFIGCFGTSTFMTLLFNINPWLTTLNVFFPRMLFGLVAGLLYKLFKKTVKNEIVSDALTMVLSSIIHTVVFVTIFYLAFSKDPAFQDYNTGFFAFIWTMFGINAVVEWAVCGVAGTAILKTLVYFITRYDRKKAEKEEKTLEESEPLTNSADTSSQQYQSIEDADDDIGTLIIPQASPAVSKQIDIAESAEVNNSDKE
ncbi:MAG: ECF transporter S component [Clostridia bacterium]|nr:ECF transporter S component [Clostridia bacterium]